MLVFLRLREVESMHFQVTLHQQCDNSASVGAIGKLFATKAPMPFDLQALAHHCSRSNASVQVTHLAGKKNILADGISRNLVNVMSTLPPGTQVSDFTLQEVLEPVWVFAQQ